MLSEVIAVKKLDGYWRITVQGGVDALIKKISQHNVKDLIFNQASLEDFFMEFYKDE